jgi:hypothetical protein
MTKVYVTGYKPATYEEGVIVTDEREFSVALNLDPLQVSIVLPVDDKVLTEIPVVVGLVEVGF